MTTSGALSRWQRMRPPLAFLVGVLILFHEVVIYKGGERPYILLVAVTLMGLASFLKADEALKKLGVQVTIQQREDEETKPPSAKPPTQPREEGAGP